MEDGYFLRECFFENKKKILNSYNFITIKPQIYVCNVDEDSIINGNKYSKLVENFAEKKKCKVLKISAEIESQIAIIEDPEEKKNF